MSSFTKSYVSLSSPILLTAPHGGTVKHADQPDIPLRTEGCFEPDTDTIPLALSLKSAFKTDHAVEASLIYLELHRELVDGNRPLHSACSSDSPAAVAHSHYHELIDETLRAIVARHGHAILIDVHGQSHRPGVSELGYLVTVTDLLKTDEELDAVEKVSSIDALKKGRGLAQVVRGPKSLGTLLSTRGHGSTPSALVPQPCSAEALANRGESSSDCPCSTTYFHGGYSTRRYTQPRSLPETCPIPADVDYTSSVVGVQIEVCWEERKSEAKRQTYAKNLASAVMEFMDAFIKF
jgi:N-formylglutamate amidohydrolase